MILGEIMLYDEHMKYGEIFCEHFDIDKDFSNWSTVPDYKFYLKSKMQNKFFHRFTNHGVDNTIHTVKLAKDNDKFYFDKDYLPEIYHLVLSHSYLDLFNSIIIPSYPNNYEFNYIPEQWVQYITPLSSAPDDISEAFKSIIYEYNDVNMLTENLAYEYRNLPGTVCRYTKEILSYY